MMQGRVCPCFRNNSEYFNLIYFGPKSVFAYKLLLDKVEDLEVHIKER